MQLVLDLVGLCCNVILDVFVDHYVLANNSAAICGVCAKRLCSSVNSVPLNIPTNAMTMSELG